MAAENDVSISDLVRSDPVRSALLSFGPILLAGAQIANSYFNDLSFLASVPFAVAMVLIAVLLTQHHAAQYRRRRVERDL
ncbi:hypothetical protein ACNS7O_10510 [Haloferacaceae archaeon DSL9]